MSQNAAIQEEVMQETWWQNIVGTALVGTDRQSPEKPVGESPLYRVVQQLDWQAPEATLLKAAGIFSVYQQAGKSSSQKALTSEDSSEDSQPPIEPAEPDVRPCCSVRLSAHLKVGLEQYPQAIKELLLLLADAEQRVSLPLLPAVLRHGEKYVDAQPYVEAVLGNRGRWLAQQNPAWQYVSSSPGAVSEHDIARWRSHWQSGTKKQRLPAIRKWRQVDPDGAREAIAATWKSEDWRTRESVTLLFHTNLSMADEPFLEAALSDRAGGVQQNAAACLARLPASRLCQRMVERVQAFVRFESSALKETLKELLTLKMTLPDAFDASWKKDGIKETSLNGLSDQASWIAQMIARTPLNVWPTDLDGIQTLLTQHRDRLVLLHGWAQAVDNQRNTPLASAWVSVLLHQLGAQEWEKPVLHSMLATLSAQQKEQYLRSHLPTKANDQSSSHWLQLVADCEQKWDYDFSRLALMQLAQVMQGKRKYGDLFSPPGSLALSLHPGVAPEAQRIVENWTQNQRPTKAWQRFVDEFLGVLMYRWQMYQLFADTG